VSGGHGHPFHFFPHQYPLVDVEECLHLICWAIYPPFIPILTGWCIAPVRGNNLGMQVTKPVSFSSAYEGLHNCMLC